MFPGFLKGHVERLKYYDAVTGMSKILRRYFVMNSFDGALTFFGLILGSFSVGITDYSLLVRVGLATSIAMGFSGLSGAFMTERAERARELKGMERLLHRKLDNTDYKKAYDFATVVTGIVNGLSPLFVSLFLLSPFLFIRTLDAYYVSFGMAFALFFIQGAFLGGISKENLLLTAIRQLVVGVLCMAVILFLENIG
ncbi:MAG: hypothetical protein AB1324_03170 [Candidatus Micrarchaeota archaeon]